MGEVWGRSAGLADPGGVQLGVYPVVVHEILVRALLDQPPVIEHEDLVGGFGGRQPVGDRH